MTVLFEMIEKPHAFFQFSDRKDVSRPGRAKAIVGENSTKCKPTWPTLKVKIQNEHVTTESDPLWIFVDLFQKSGVKPHLSPHNLVTFNESSGKEEVFDSGKQMTNIGGGEYSFSLENYFIVKTANTYAKDTLMKKIMLKEKWETSLGIKREKENIIFEVQDISLNNDGEITQLYLGFEVHIKKKILPNDFLFATLGDPYFSEMITNEKFQCWNISQPWDYIDGGTEIEICVSKISREDSNLLIRFYETDNEMWEDFCSKLSVYVDEDGTCKIKVKTPKYRGASQSRKITCYVQVKRIRDNKATLGVKFEYRKHFRKNSRKISHTSNVPCSAPDKRIRVSSDSVMPLLAPPAEDTERNSTVHINHVIRIIENTTLSTEDKIDAVESFNEDYASKNQHGNTIFHDALSNDSFNKFYKSRELHGLLTGTANIQGETLLHYACNLNRPVRTRQLIGIGCSVDALDANDNTPLHIAIREKSHDCIQVFTTIFKRPTDYEERVRLELTQLFQIYNHEGHTVLHAAVLNDLVDLVAAMLKFCRTEDKAALGTEVLGSGDSIMHLAASRGLKQMAQIIFELSPGVMDYENYAGDTIFDIEKYKMFANDFLELCNGTMPSNL